MRDSVTSTLLRRNSPRSTLTIVRLTRIGHQGSALRQTLIDWAQATSSGAKRCGLVKPAEGGQALEYSYWSEAQRSAFEQAEADCDQEIGVPPPPETLSVREIRQRYAFLVEARACLTAAGHDLPEPPSEDAFVESWATNPWSPFNDLPFMSTEAWTQLTEECPQA